MKSLVTPRWKGALQGVYAFLISPRLAIALLVAVLACCLAAVTMLRDERAWELVFSTLWFNALLVLLALSSGAAFFSRIWRRKLTIVSAGMILFHLSFVALLGGIVYDGFFFFRGVLRLTEGETLPTDRLESYDAAHFGRLFDFDRLRGEATLHRMHSRYLVGEDDKRAAYDVSVGEDGDRVTGTVYVNQALAHRGVRYLRSKEGYSTLVIMYDRAGRELYGVHVPLQSHRLPSGRYRYVSGSADEAEAIPFPAPPDEALFSLLLRYVPEEGAERAGAMTFEIHPLDHAAAQTAVKKGDAAVGARYEAGDVLLEAREIRYWAAMDVRYDPGLPVILGSLCFGLFGMVLTLIGRVRQGAARRRRAELAAARSGSPELARAGEEAA